MDPYTSAGVMTLYSQEALTEGVGLGYGTLSSRLFRSQLVRFQNPSPSPHTSKMGHEAVPDTQLCSADLGSHSGWR